MIIFIVTKKNKINLNMKSMVVSQNTITILTFNTTYDTRSEIIVNITNLYTKNVT